jgi:hypothetical protein
VGRSLLSEDFVPPVPQVNYECDPRGGMRERLKRVVLKTTCTLEFLLVID